jgi:hypothetical protein
MIPIELTPEEAEELRLVLRSYLSDLRWEIRETDSYEFRAKLKAREAFLRKLLGQLGEEELDLSASQQSA